VLHLPTAGRTEQASMIKQLVSQNNLNTIRCWGTLLLHPNWIRLLLGDSVWITKTSFDSDFHWHWSVTLGPLHFPHLSRHA